MSETNIEPDEIFSQNEESFFNAENFCGNCGHLIETTHSIGQLTGIVKCYALIYNGCVWSSCNCHSIIFNEYEIRGKYYEIDELSNIAGNGIQNNKGKNSKKEIHT